MAEERGDGFETHPAVDGLCGEGVAKLVRVDGPDAGAFRDAGDGAMDGASIEWLAVVAFDKTAGSCWSALGSVIW